jgi:hypothetical protein
MYSPDEIRKIRQQCDDARIRAQEICSHARDVVRGSLEALQEGKAMRTRRRPPPPEISNREADGPKG